MAQVELLEIFDKMENMEVVIEFTESILALLEKPVKMDLSRSLIFVIGNLDELYWMAGDMNPNINPDIFYQESLKIKLPQVKLALKKRFRNEQIARLGNNHIIYPAFSSRMYNKLIDLKLDQMKAKISKRLGVQVAFDRSILALVWQEGVFPTQGARPIIQSIQTLIEPSLFKAIYEMVVENNDVSRIHVSHHKNKVLVQVFDKKGRSLGFCDSVVELKMPARKPRSNKEERTAVAVHESGHAILAALQLRILPDEVVSVSDFPNSLGYCKINYPDGPRTRELIEHDIILGLGGYAAEKIIFGKAQTSAGVCGDIQTATEMAMDAMKLYGMGTDTLYVNHPHPELNDAYTDNVPFEDQARELVNNCKKEAQRILLENK
ncbi:MAG: hypothetical protein IH946_09965 [Bacteroidetes bacterium]|nr:hypothetical protein [Bacteroidota bacterium]